MHGLVIGGRPAGVTATLDAAVLGAEVTLVARGPHRRHRARRWPSAGAHAGPGGSSGSRLDLVGGVRSAAGHDPRWMWRQPGRRRTRRRLRP
jgi:hypothetical protein